MNMEILIFIACTVANVILMTVKSIMTVKGGKIQASVWNAISYGLYTYIVILTATAPFGTEWKIIITAGCNLVGVFIVKLIEEKMRKTRLWKIELTVRKIHEEKMAQALENANIPYNYIQNIGKHTIFNIYCETPRQTEFVTDLAKLYNGKTFASETKLV